MKKKQRIFSILSCLCVGLMVTAIGAINTTEAAAEETAIFAMNAGASVRIDDNQSKSGIRWNAVMNETYWTTFKTENKITEDTVVAFGAFVAPIGNVGDGELTVETSEAKPIECKGSDGNVISTPAFDDNGLFTFYSSILYNDTDLVDIERAAYATELVARSYIRVGEGDNATYTYVDGMYREVKTEEGVVNDYGYAYELVNVTRSMQAIALAAMQSGEKTSAQVGKYYKADGEDVVTSETSSGYYSEMDKTGSLVNVHNVTTDYKAYVGALPVELTLNEGVLTIANFANLKAGETYNLNLFSTEGKAYTQPFVYATKVIDEASDLSVFDLGSSANIYTNCWNNANAFDGYYVLTKDIDCSDYVHTVSANQVSASSTSYAMTGHVKKGAGLTGVFEGNGHTISNLTMRRRGLFGVIAGGTVQNVGFTNLKFDRGQIRATGSCTGQNFYALACAIESATLKNVYVHIPTMKSSYLSEDGTTSGMTTAASTLRNAGLAHCIDGSTVMENCVIKIDEYEYATYTSMINYGSLMCVADDETGAYANFKNVYVISDVALAGSKEDTSTQADASNQTATITISGAKRYATEEAMQADATKNAESLATFSSEYWTVTDGVLSWN